MTETEQGRGVLPDLIYLLRSAEQASSEVDNYDLHGEDPDNVSKWRVIIKEERVALRDLVKHVAQNQEALMFILGDVNAEESNSEEDEARQQGKPGTD